MAYLHNGTMQGSKASDIDNSDYPYIPGTSQLDYQSDVLSADNPSIDIDCSPLMVSANMKFRYHPAAQASAPVPVLCRAQLTIRHRTGLRCRFGISLPVLPMNSVSIYYSVLRHVFS